MAPRQLQIRPGPHEGLVAANVIRAAGHLAPKRLQLRLSGTGRSRRQKADNTQISVTNGPPEARRPVAIARLVPDLVGDGSCCYLMSGGRPITNETTNRHYLKQLPMRNIRLRQARQASGLAAMILAVVVLAWSPPPASAAKTATVLVARAAATPRVNVLVKVTTAAAPDYLAWLQLVAVAAAVGSVLMVRKQLLLSAKETRQQRAAEIVALWTDRDFRTNMSRFLAFIAVRDVDDCVRKLRGWIRAGDSEERSLPLVNDTAANRPEPPKTVVSALSSKLKLARRNRPSRRRSRTETPPASSDRFLCARNDVLYVLGAADIIALRYNGKEVEQRWIAVMVGSNLIATLQNCLWLIWFIRAFYNDPTVNYELVTTVHDLRQTHSDWSPHPNLEELTTTIFPGPIRVICLPPRPRTAPDEEWSRASRLSVLLGSEQAQDSLCEFLSVRVRKEPADLGWRVIVVPGSVDSTTEQDEKGREDLSNRLNDRVSALTAAEVDREIGRLTRLASESPA